MHLGQSKEPRGNDYLTLVKHGGHGVHGGSKSVTKNRNHPYQIKTVQTASLLFRNRAAVWLLVKASGRSSRSCFRSILLLASCLFLAFFLAFLFIHTIHALQSVLRYFYSEEVLITAQHFV